MKTNSCTILVSFFLLLLASSCRGFSPLKQHQQTCFHHGVATKTTSPSLLKTSKVDEISHELEELGQEIKPQLRPQSHGMNEFHESLVHKLRRAIHEKDAAYHKALDELEKREKQQFSMDRLTHTLQDIQKNLVESKAYAIAWEATEVNLRNEVEHRQKKQAHNQSLQDLVQTLQRIEKDLTDTKAYALAWETAEVELYREKRDHEQEHESVRRLLWQAVKLSLRRVKNGVLGIFKRRQSPHIE